MRSIFYKLAVCSLPLLVGGCQGFDLSFNFGSDSQEHYEATEAWDGRAGDPPKRSTVAPY